jgi:hypothetical protein
MLRQLRLARTDLTDRDAEGPRGVERVSDAELGIAAVLMGLVILLTVVVGPTIL